VTARADAWRARFWAKVQKTPTCWLWTGQIDRHGYGTIKRDGKMRRAHREVFEMEVGPIPEGLQPDHTCRVRHCVNPAHLDPVTSGENTLRGEGPAAQNARKARCDNGHEYTPENTYHQAGRRNCRTCRRDRDALRTRPERRRRAQERTAA
jgi:hypothetical protein